MVAIGTNPPVLNLLIYVYDSVHIAPVYSTVYIDSETGC